MRVQPNPENGSYTLLEPLRACGERVYKGKWVEVPAGFAWNGASIPRIAWTAIGYTPFHPRLMRASCVHDWLYTLKKGSRRDADELFRQLLIEDGVLEHAAGTMYRAVRQFGVVHWKDAEDLRRELEIQEMLDKSGEMN